ncbi:DUF4232 domain-containing protein [Streptomyces sp. T-3]|nr:DUF4232 domain-containing protein [Streptomyces sp. T-3]
MTRLHVRTAALIAVGLLTATTTAATATDDPGAGRPAVCRTGDLALDWASGGSAQPGGKDTAGKDTAGRQVDVLVAMKNTASHSCTLHGYPKVTLEMGTETRGVVTETFQDQKAQQPKTVTLAPGGTARFTLSFISAKDSDKDAIAPGVADITPPGNAEAKQLRWNWGEVARQEAATHPGNLVSPVCP